MKKYAPRKVYILENRKYVELEYTEFEKQKSKDFAYNDKFFIPVQGCLLEVAQEEYESFYRSKEREKYLKKLDKINGLLSIDAFDNDDNDGTDYIQAESVDVAETVTNLILTDKLRLAVALLPDKEKELIHALFFKNMTEREYAKECGVSQVAIHKRKNRILAKLKKILEN